MCWLICCERLCGKYAQEWSDQSADHCGHVNTSSGDSGGTIITRYEAGQQNAFSRRQNGFLIMSRDARLSEKKNRAQIVALRQAVFRQQHIADRLQCRQSSICYAIRIFQETGSNLDHPRSGRPRVSTRADDAYMCTIAHRRTNPRERIQYQIHRSGSEGCVGPPEFKHGLWHIIGVE